MRIDLVHLTEEKRNSAQARQGRPMRAALQLLPESNRATAPGVPEALMLPAGAREAWAWALPASSMAR
jgi:hypothetical protein